MTLCHRNFFSPTLRTGSVSHDAACSSFVVPASAGSFRLKAELRTDEPEASAQTGSRPSPWGLWDDVRSIRPALRNKAQDIHAFLKSFPGKRLSPRTCRCAISRRNLFFIVHLAPLTLEAHTRRADFSHLGGRAIGQRIIWTCKEERAVAESSPHAPREDYYTHHAERDVYH